MSFDFLQAEILEEFAAFAPALAYSERCGYGLRTSEDERRAYNARWRADNAAWIASPEFRARAVANTRRWVFVHDLLHAED